MNVKPLGAMALAAFLAACSGAGDPALSGGGGADPLATPTAQPAVSDAGSTWDFMGLRLFNRHSDPHTDEMHGQGE